MNNSFEKVAASSNNSNWNKLIKREKDLYTRTNNIRSEFQRDYTRVLFSNSYKRLKNKTQVFFSPSNDHVCTRIEHVNYVESISYTIANELGLNTELTKAIAIAHDLGHSPFGHQGERVLNKILKFYELESFWHEKNGLVLVDDIELLDNKEGKKENLNLTYAVRDGIISHCGEVDENAIKPRTEYINLQDYKHPNQYPPFTWEGCIVKIADKISYVGRDIEDAIRMNILDETDIAKLREILKMDSSRIVNNANIISDLIFDIVTNSSIEEGLKFSKEKLDMLNNIKKFNYNHIYLSERAVASNDYIELVLITIFNKLFSLYDDQNKCLDIAKIAKETKYYGEEITNFINWIAIYSKSSEIITNGYNIDKYKNKKIYDLSNVNDYIKAIIQYISGMTDQKAINSFNHYISF